MYDSCVYVILNASGSGTSSHTRLATVSKQESPTMDFSKLSKTVAATKADAPATPAKAETAPTSALALRPTGANVLAAIANADTAPARSGFPLLYVTGGNSGGAITPAKFVPAEIADNLPQGKKPVRGVYLAHRIEIAAWPEGYKDEQGDSDAPRRPAWTAEIPGEAGEDISVLTRACKAYQYTPLADKVKFDFAAEAAVGHIRPVISLLMYLPDTDGVVVVQPPAHYNAFVNTAGALAKNADPATGALEQFPAVLTVVSKTTTAKGSGKSWTIHHLDVVADVTPKGKDTYAAFQKWKATVAEDPATVASIMDWINCTENPLSEENRARLRRAAAWDRMR